MSNTNEKQSFATRAVHAGNGIDTNTGAIKHAITMANSYVLPYDATTLLTKVISKKSLLLLKAVRIA